MNQVESKLKEFGLLLPNVRLTTGSFVPFILDGRRLLLSGQTCRSEGYMTYQGCVGSQLTIEQGREAARICLLNLLAQVQMACGGNFDRLDRCLRLTVYINSAEGFSDQSAVANAASELLLNLFGNAGVHVRSAIGVAGLPGNSAVEIDAEFLLSQD